MLNRRFGQSILTLLLLLSTPAIAATATLLPNGEQQFLDSVGVSLSGGSVALYIPGTSTPKTTWIDPNQTTPNTNPVILDAAGRAIIYGSGQYREVVKDSLGNIVWDQLTQDGAGLFTTANNTFSGANTFNGTTNLNGTNSFAGGTFTAPATFQNTATFQSTTTAPTQSANDNSTKVATTAFVDRQTRYRLTSNLSYYVNAGSGSDSNDCLASSGTGGHGPCLTIQRPVNIIEESIDSGGNTVTIYLADGTYNAGAVVAGAVIGNTEIFIEGDATTPNNVVIQVPANGVGFYAEDHGIMTVGDMIIQGGSGSIGIEADKQGGVDFRGINFGPMPGGTHVYASRGGKVICIGNYSVGGNATYHLGASSGGFIDLSSNPTVNLSASLAFTAWASSGYGAYINAGTATTYTGASATGVRATANANATIQVNGNTTAFPGSSAYTTSYGGQIQ